MSSRLALRAELLLLNILIEAKDSALLLSQRAD